MKTLPDILALCGAAGSGKSTIAAELVARHGYTLVKFAAPLKAMLSALGLTPDEIEGHLKEQPCAFLGGATPRHAMQTLGTEWGRQLIHADLWTSAWQRTAHQLLARGQRVLIDDCRYFNELATVLKLGGVAVRLVRDGAGLSIAHSSESSLLDVAMPTIANDASPGEVAARVAAVMTREL